jgi:hypothetical protein
VPTSFFLKPKTPYTSSPTPAISSLPSRLACDYGLLALRICHHPLSHTHFFHFHICNRNHNSTHKPPRQLLAPKANLPCHPGSLALRRDSQLGPPLRSIARRSSPHQLPLPHHRRQGSEKLPPANLRLKHRSRKPRFKLPGAVGRSEQRSTLSIRQLLPLSSPDLVLARRANRPRPCQMQGSFFPRLSHGVVADRDRPSTGPSEEPSNSPPLAPTAGASSKRKSRNGKKDNQRNHLPLFLISPI